MLGGLCKAPANSHGLNHRSVTSQIIFAWVPDLTADDEIRFLELFEMNRDNWVVEYLGVRASNRLLHFWDRLPFHMNIARSRQTDVTIGLHAHRLIELRCQGKI